MSGFQPGDVYAGLRIQREIGRGAYGRVYLAEDATIGRRVAIKVIPALPGSIDARRSLREARMVGRIQSPNTVTLYRAIRKEDDDSWILEMEYVAGGSLTELLEEETAIPLQRALALARDIFTGLQAAHEASVIHGDIKPSNVLLDPSGTAKLADFGLGWALDETLATSSRSEPLGGTPAYMSPEVIMGERGRAASDLWSAGVVFHRMLSGAPPFPTGTLQELFSAVQNEPPAPLPDSVPAHVQDVVLALLQKNPLDRPPSAAAVLGRLAGLAPIAVAEGIAEPRVSRPAPAALLPLFGRDSEMEALRRRIEALADGEGALVLVSGDVGAGKTALVRHVAAAARAANTAVLEANVTEFDGLLRPLNRVCRQTLALGTEVTIGAEARAAFEVELSHSAQEPAISREQFGWALEQFLGALADRSPVLVVIDDVQAARNEEVSILREIARSLRGRPILLLVTCMTAGEETTVSATQGLAGFLELAALEGVKHLTLGKLAPEALLQLLHDRNEGLRLDSAVARRVVDTAEGNPLLAIELLRHLQETGAVLLEGSTLRASTEWLSESLPQRVHDVVARRLEGLDDEARSLIDAAAVDGRVFDGAAVQSVVDRPLLVVLRGLQRLYRERRLIEPSGDVFRFGSRVVHEVIYQQVAPALRAALHERLAEYYEESRGRIDDERLAVHWERAGHPDRARPYLVRAAHAARARQDDTQVVSLFDRAGLSADPLPDDWIRSDPTSVLVLCRALNQLDRTELAATLALAVFQRAEDRDVATAAGVHHAEMAFYASGPDAVDQALLERAGQQLEPSLARGEALYLQGVIAKHRGDLELAAPFLRRAEEVYAAADLPVERIAAMQQLASVALRSEEFEDAERMFLEAARHAHAVGRRSAALSNEVNAVLARVERGELDGAEPRLARAFHALQLSAGPVPTAHAGTLLAALRYSLGDISGAAATIAQAREMIAGHENLLVNSDIHAWQSLLLCVRGQLGPAMEECERFAALAEQANSRTDRVHAACSRAHILVCLGEREAAGAALTACGNAVVPSGLWLMMAVLVPFGLPVSALPPSAAPGHGMWREALESFASPSADPGVLRRLVTELTQHPPGWLRASAAHLRDSLAFAAACVEQQDASEIARGALRVAEHSGHVWWGAYWLRELARTSGDPFYEERLDELIVRIARALPDATSQRRVMVAWAPSN